MRVRSIAAGFGLVAWLATLFACLLTAFLLRDKVSDWLNYLTWLVVPQVLPAAVAAFVFVLALERGEGRTKRQGALFAVVCSLAATLGSTALLFAIDKDRPNDARGVAFFLALVVALCLVNGFLALLLGTFGAWLASRAADKKQ